MIATRAEIKKLLQITDNSSDATIDALIPVIRADIVRYTNNHFTNPDVWINSGNISFTNATPPTINDSDSNFVTQYFHSNMDIWVAGSYYNDGLYHVDTAAAGTLTLGRYESLSSEDLSAATEIYKVIWPNELKLTMARMINFNLQKSSLKNVKSESIGGYSISYGDIGNSGYPKFIENDLNRFRRLK